MGKKNKKFQKGKKNKHQANPVVERQINIVEANGSEAAAIIDPIANNRPEPKEEIKVTPQEELSDDFYKTDKYNYVKKDVIKIVIILFCIIVLLFVAYYLSTQTSIFSKFGDWIFKICNIQTE